MNTDLKPYKGYVYFPRAIMLIFQRNKAIDFDGLGSFIAFALECDWDKKHPTYGLLVKPFDYLARKWHCNPSTVYRKRDKLVSLGLLKHEENGYVRLKYFEWFDPSISKELATMEFADSQDLIAQTQKLVANVQGKVADSQIVQDQFKPQSFNVSSKGNISVIQEESDTSTGLSKEDIDWINDNVHEDIT